MDNQENVSQENMKKLRAEIFGENEIRYFFFSAAFLMNGIFSITNFSTQREGFPSKKKLTEIVEEQMSEKGTITQISILSICELSKTDFDTFWHNENVIYHHSPI